MAEKKKTTEKTISLEDEIKDLKAANEELRELEAKLKAKIKPEVEPEKKPETETILDVEPEKTRGQKIVDGLKSAATITAHVGGWLAIGLAAVVLYDHMDGDSEGGGSSDSEAV